MGASISIERATLAHAEELAPRLRLADVEELRVNGAESPLEALTRSVSASEVALSVRLNGELACMGGVRVLKPRETFLGAHPLGCAWLLTGRACDTHRKAFVATVKQWVPALQRASECAEVRNLVDVRYTGALALLRRVGFVVLAEVPHGPLGLPFALVSRRM